MTSIRVAMSLAVCATTGCGHTSASATPGGDPAAGPIVIVANQESESATLLNLADGAARHLRVGAGPHEVFTSPDGTTAVVTIYGARVSGNQLAIISLVTDSVIRTVDLGQYTRPHGGAFLGESNEEVVVTSESTGNVVKVNIGTGLMEAIPTNARSSHMLAVERSGERGWTANMRDSSVSELDLKTNRFVRRFTVPAIPEGIAVTPDGAEVWVGSNATGAVTVISTETGESVHTITGAIFPYRLAASPDGRIMAIVDDKGDRLLIADVRSRQYTDTIALASPRGVVIGRDNRTAYVTLAAGEVAVVDLNTSRVTRTLMVQNSPDGVAVAYGPGRR